MVAQIKIRGNKKFDNVYRHNINQGGENRRFTVYTWRIYSKCVVYSNKVLVL